jgi:hypothetical protein
VKKLHDDEEINKTSFHVKQYNSSIQGKAKSEVEPDKVVIDQTPADACCLKTFTTDELKAFKHEWHNPPKCIFKPFSEV